MTAGGVGWRGLEVSSNPNQSMEVVGSGVHRQLEHTDSAEALQKAVCGLQLDRKAFLMSIRTGN